MSSTQNSSPCIVSPQQMLDVIKECIVFNKKQKIKTKLGKCYSRVNTGIYGRAKQGNYIVSKGFIEEVMLKMGPDI